MPAHDDLGKQHLAEWMVGIEAIPRRTMEYSSI